MQRYVLPKQKQTLETGKQFLDLNSNDCFKEFGEQGKLMCHMTTFHGDKQYFTYISKVCNVCQRIFTKSKILKRHILLHSGAISCDKCKRNLTLKANKDRHRCLLYQRLKVPSCKLQCN